MMPGDLPEVLWEIINAVSRKDWTQLELKANQLKEWARAAKKAATDIGDNQFLGNGGRQDGG